jgi:hypothetical protein
MNRIRQSLRIPYVFDKNRRGEAQGLLVAQWLRPLGDRLKPSPTHATVVLSSSR